MELMTERGYMGEKSQHTQCHTVIGRETHKASIDIETNLMM